jgi:protoporphyrinogen oxidase
MKVVMLDSKPIVCIGAGPAGLTCAYELARRGRRVIVLEADPHYVGGIARTEKYKGFCIDVGGHRFFSKSKKIEDFWSEILGSDLLVRRRHSRILYQGKFFSYPLRPLEALWRLGFGESTRCAFSYLSARLRVTRPAKTFAEWVSQRFGRRLFWIFFKTYTEKVWGMSCDEISADWAAQRINNVSALTALLGRYHALFARKGDTVKSLIDSFRYPRKGPGMMWEKLAEKVAGLGGEIRMGLKVSGIRKTGNGWHIQGESRDGSPFSLSASQVVSSMPIRELARALEPAPQSRAAAESLRYRDFLVVALIIKGRELFADNWIYVHEESVKVGRIQNFRAASPEMVPGPEFHCYGMEYFCFEGDGLWESPDEDLISLAKGELQALGLAGLDEILDAKVVRQRKAYPVYDEGYKAAVTEVRDDLERNFSGLHLIGRNGMHKYNNQDHSMMTAMLTSENIVAGRQVYDVWNVNQDAEYLEIASHADSATEFGVRMVPSPAATADASR